jgi:hypothetical protein
MPAFFFLGLPIACSGEERSGLVINPGLAWMIHETCCCGERDEPVSFVTKAS